MTEPHFPEVDGIIEFASYPWDEEDTYEAEQTTFESGHIQARSRRSMRRRRFRLIAKYLRPLDTERIMGFLNDIKGGGNFFYIDDRVNPVWPPYIAPTIIGVGGGTMGSRTYYVKTAFANTAGTQITTPSQEASVLVPASFVLRVTVNDFPPGVDRVNIYIGTASGVNYFSGYSTTPLGFWTESIGSTTVNTDSPLGTDIVFVASTTDFKVGDTIRLHDGGARQEDQIVKAILSGPTRIQIEGTLTFTHTLAQADPVEAKVGLSTQAVPVTTNGMTPQEVKVLLQNEPRPKLMAAKVYSISLDLVELLP